MLRVYLLPISNTFVNAVVQFVGSESWEVEISSEYKHILRQFDEQCAGQCMTTVVV